MANRQDEFTPSTPQRAADRDDERIGDAGGTTDDVRGIATDEDEDDDFDDDDDLDESEEEEGDDL
jgi:hypothetical protein